MCVCVCLCAYVCACVCVGGGEWVGARILGHKISSYEFSPFLFSLPLPLCLPLSLSLSVTHKLSNGVTTKYPKEFKVTGKLSFLFPKCADEFQQMINVVLYNPSLFTFHHRMRQALVYMQMGHYPHFDKS